MTLPASHEIRSSLTVSFDYRVLFSDGVLEGTNPLLADLLAADGRGRALVFADQGLCQANPKLVGDTRRYFDLHRDRLALVAEPVVAPGGERAKRDMQVFNQCVRAIYDAQLDRHSYVVAIGGGAMLDAVGFAASSVHRGIRQIRIPTTVLAQNDAGIGVKNGVDYLGKKNFLGSFYPPYAVVNDFSLLLTLTGESWRDGTAEAVKVAVIADPAFFAWIETHADALAGRDQPAMRFLIRRCAELHLAHITSSGDPFERGSARPLDFGHWSAHKLEQLSDFRISHGNAVAVGMAIDVAYSLALGLLNEAQANRIIQCLRRLGFGLEVAPLAGLGNDGNLDRLLHGVAEFQEHLGGQLCLTMLRGIGTPIEIGQVDIPLLRQCCGRIILGQ